MADPQALESTSGKLVPELRVVEDSPRTNLQEESEESDEDAPSDEETDLVNQYTEEKQSRLAAHLDVGPSSTPEEMAKRKILETRQNKRKCSPVVGVAAAGSLTIPPPTSQELPSITLFSNLSLGNGSEPMSSAPIKVAPNSASSPLFSETPFGKQYLGRKLPAGRSSAALDPNAGKFILPFTLYCDE